MAEHLSKEYREEVQQIINYTLATELLPAIAEIKNRIVAIDRNGTGTRPGILQLQDVEIKKLQESQNRLQDGQVKIERKIDDYHKDATTWSKKDVIKSIAWVCGTIISIIAVIFSYLQYHNAFHSSEPLFTQHSITADNSTSAAN